MEGIELDRRQFLQMSGASALMLSLNSLGILGGKAHATQKILQEWDYSTWEDLHRNEWTWDKVTWGTHLVDCYPGNCLWRVYTKDGVVLREEQAAKYPVVDSNSPDFNPRGCQKGACYSNLLQNPDRVTHPMKRVGERGSGKWKRVSWDQALTEIAQGILDALEEQGPESIIYEPSPGTAGWLHWFSVMRLNALLGGTMIDGNSLIGDTYRGVYQTMGKFFFVDSHDNWFFSKLIFIWHMNPVYTRIPSFHFIQEARYTGAEVITVAPDYSPSAIHADEWVPVEPGTDGALALSICQVLIERGHIDVPFIKEQTDLPMLIRMDTKRFLRAQDIEEKGREDQFYYWDKVIGGPVKAPLDTLKLPCDPVMEGSYSVTLLDGKRVEVRTSFDLLKEILNREYTPEKASKHCHTHPETIRRLAEKAHQAKGRIQILLGLNASKYYHGDLIERALCLLISLTGSLGKKGSGIRGFNPGLFEGALFVAVRGEKGKASATNQVVLEHQVMNKYKSKDPTLTEEMLSIHAERDRDRYLGAAPPAFLHYFHSGYKDTWDRKEWHCPTMKREFPEYMEEALENGWWEGVDLPYRDQTPRVYSYLGTSPARKNRGWNKNILPSLWKKYRLIYGLETRWSTTVLYSDYVLPCAGSYEKIDTRMPTVEIPWLTFTDIAVNPPGEAKTEFEITAMLAKKIEEVAKGRGKTKFLRRNGREVDLSNFGEKQSMGCENQEELLEDALETTVLTGSLPPGTNLQKFREEGIVRFVGRPSVYDPISMNLSTDIEPNEPVVPLTWHTGSQKTPYPTYNRRIQFYIDHPWHLEAEEELPAHKPNPKIGGNYPLTMLSGHLRWSVHSIWITDEQLLRTHQGRPFMFINPEDAEKRGIKEGDLVRVYNDFDEFHIHTKLAASARPEKGTRPGEIIIYHAWEPFMFKKWKSYDTAIPGMIKWLDLAGGYGHLNYWLFNWCLPCVDRAVAVEVEKAS